MAMEYKKQNTAAQVLERIEAHIDRMVEHPYLKKIKISDVCEELSIFDWWPEYLTKSKLQEMRQFCKEAIKLGYEGYVCFKVGARGCANGMWAYPELCTEEGYAPSHTATLFRSFTPAYLYWDISNREGKWDWEGKYATEEDRNNNYDRLKTIKDLEAFIETQPTEQVYRK